MSKTQNSHHSCFCWTSNQDEYVHEKAVDDDDVDVDYDHDDRDDIDEDDGVNHQSVCAMPEPSRRCTRGADKAFMIRISWA